MAGATFHPTPQGQMNQEQSYQSTNDSSTANSPTTTRPLVAIFPHPELGPSVSGRELYPQLVSSKSDRDLFTDWFAKVIVKVKLEKGADYLRATYSRPQQRSVRDYIISLPAAIRIAQASVKRRAAVMMPYLMAHGQPSMITSSPLGFTPNGGLPLQSQPQLEPPVHKLPRETTQMFALPNRPRDYMVQPEQAAAPETRTDRLRRELREAEEEETRQSIDHPPVNDADVLLRLGSIESKLDTLLRLFQPSGHHPPDLVSLHQQRSLRAQVGLMIEDYVSKIGCEHQYAWRMLYQQLSLRFGFDVYLLAKQQRSHNYLDVIEQYGQIENLYNIARQFLAVPKNSYSYGRQLS